MIRKNSAACILHFIVMGIELKIRSHRPREEMNNIGAQEITDAHYAAIGNLA